MLGSAALVPMYGKLSDLIGRKPVLYSSVLIFLVRHSTYYNYHQINSAVRSDQRCAGRRRT